MAGVHAAYPLVHSGKRVLMLDGGVRAAALPHPGKGKDFEEVRITDDEQHRLFLGDELEAIVPVVGGSHASSMTSGARAYVSEQTSQRLPLRGEGVDIVQTLAQGGLSEAWGGVCAVFTENELESAGLPVADMSRHYQEVMRRIGISGDEAGYQTQPPARITAVMERLLTRYRSVGRSLQSTFVLRQPLLGVLTQPLGTREPLAYRDLEYYRTDEKTLYRARYTLEGLMQKQNFEYRSEQVVERVVPGEEMQEVVSRDFSGERRVFRARRVILAAGAVNTTRIALQSGFTQSAELFIKPNYILACLDIHSLTQHDPSARHSLCQLTLDIPATDGQSAVFAHLYNYRSLLLWRLLSRIPLPAPETFSLLAMYAPSLVLVDARLPGSEGICRATLEGTTLVITRDTRTASYRPQLRTLKRFLRTLGLYTLHSSPQPLGASVHYAGGVTVETSGKLIGRSGIYAADSSGWKALSGKPPALTIMANANRIGEAVCASLIEE